MQNLMIMRQPATTMRQIMGESRKIMRQVKLWFENNIFEHLVLTAELKLLIVHAFFAILFQYIRTLFGKI